jgi:hypothetical protein
MTAQPSASEAQRGIVIADAADRVARDAAVVNVRAGGDFAGHHDEAGGNERFRRDASGRVMQ